MGAVFTFPLGFCVIPHHLIFNVQSVNLVKSFGSVAASNTSIGGFVKYMDMHWIPVALIVVSFVAEVRLKFFFLE